MTGFVDPFAVMAWAQLWQVTLVAAAALLLSRVCCRRRPHLAYMLLMIVVLKCLTPPILSSPVGVFSWMDAAPNDAPGDAAGSLEMARATGFPAQPVGEASHSRIEGPAATARGSDPRPSNSIDVATVLIAIWIVGALTLSGLFTWGWVRRHRRLRESCEPADAGRTELLGRLAARLGVRRRVKLFVSSRPYGPLCFGLLRAAIVLPEELLRKPSTHLEPILAHELAHVRRRDGLAAAVQALAGFLWWFHPLVWWVNREISRQRERCCDEEAVAGTGCPPERYAQSLVDVLKFKRTWRLGFAVFGIRPVDVTQARLEAIVNPRRNLYTRMPWFGWLALAAGLVLVVPGKGLVGDRVRGDEPRLPRTAKKQTPNKEAAKKDARFSPREAEADIRNLIEKFVKAASDGDVKAVEKLLGGNPRRLAKRYLEDTKKVLAMGAKPAEVVKVVAGPDRAIAVTEFFTLGKGTKREAQYCVLYQCVRLEGTWKIRDIDAERVAGLVEEIGRFVEQMVKSKREKSQR